MNRTLASAVVAIALHGAVFSATGLRRKPPAPAAPAAAAETEIDLDGPPGASLGGAAEPTAALENTGPQSRTESLISASARRASSAEAREPTSASPSPSSSTAASSSTAEPSSDGTWTFSPLQSAGEGPLPGGGLATAVSAGVRATVAEESQERDRNPRKKIVPPYSSRDIDLGLFPGSALVSLARDTVRRSRAPDLGRALLEFELDGAGVVAKVRVLDVSSGRAEWDEVAEELVREARALPPQRMPADSNGVALTIELTSAIKTVSGSTPTKNPVTQILRAIDDPIDAIIDGKTPPQRVVAARVIGVNAL